MFQTFHCKPSLFKAQSHMRLGPVKTTYDLKNRRSAATNSDYHPTKLIAVTYIMLTAIIVGPVVIQILYDHPRSVKHDRVMVGNCR